jgi:hypothetical protein
MCQVCGRMLVPLKDGTSRSHIPGSRRRRNPDGFDREYCQGAGYRLARWQPGQRLRHHSGDVWVIEEDQGGMWGDYLMHCLDGRERGRTMVAHGEYMHRHGWTALPRDLMADLEASLKAVRHA